MSWVKKLTFQPKYSRMIARALALASLAACSSAIATDSTTSSETDGSSSLATSPTVTSFTMTPKVDTLKSGERVQFSASAKWSDRITRIATVSYTATGGSVTSKGMFTAGSVPGNFLIIAVCSCALADTAHAVILPATPPAPKPVLTTVVLTPAAVTLAAGAAQQFAAAGVWSDGSTAAPPVTYTVSGGTISAGGFYSAPSAAGTYLVIAKESAGSHADTSVVTVSVPVVSTNTYARPFSDDSPWNTPVAKYKSVAQRATTAFSGFMPAMSNWPGALWVSMYQAKPSDPTVNLYYNADAWINVANGRWKRSGNSTAIEAEIRAGMNQKWDGYQGNMYSTTTAGISALPTSYHKRESTYWTLQPRVPANALPSTDADGHMTVFQPNGWALEMLAPIRLSNGDIVTLFASYTDPTGLGVGDANGRRASMVPNYAGLLRDGELGSGHIAHALVVGVGPEALAKSVVWPATAMDRETSNYRGPLPMGAFLTIPAGVDIAKLGLQTPQGRTLAKAAQEYGMYVTDQTGPRYFLILSEKNSSDVPAWNGPLDQDLRAIMAQLQVTTASGRN
jgi:hypothetical protein